MCRKLNVFVRSEEVICALHGLPTGHNGYHTHTTFRLPLSDFDNLQPRTHWFACTIYGGVPQRNGVHFSMDIVRSILKESLERTLVYYPELTGRLIPLSDGSQEVICCNEGVKWVNAQADFTFEELQSTGFDPQDLPKEIVPFETMDREWLLQIQITELKNNTGFILGFTVHHCICDGHGMFAFIRNWSALARALQHKAVHLPNFHIFPRKESNLVGTTEYGHNIPKPAEYVHTQNAFLKPWQPSPSYEAMLTAKLFRFSGERLAKLKSSLSFSEEYWMSTNDVLCALLWRGITRARQLPLDQTTTFGLACNVRKRVSPILSDEYIGCAVTYVSAVATVDTLLSNTVGEVAAKIRQAVNNVTNDRIQSVLNWAASLPHKSGINTSFKTIGGPDFQVTSFARFPIFDADFGWGGPETLRMPIKAFDGKAGVFPVKNSGDLEVFIGMKQVEMRTFEDDPEISQFLAEHSSLMLE